MLPVEPEAARIGEEPLGKGASAPDLADRDERRDEPPRANVKASPMTGSLRGASPQGDAIDGQLLADREHSASHALVVPDRKSDERNDQERSVELVGVVVIFEGAASADSVVEHVEPDLGRGRPPVRACSGRPRRSASSAARSAATQHITFEVVWWRGSSRSDQKPRSGSRQCPRPPRLAGEPFADALSAAAAGPARGGGGVEQGTAGPCREYVSAAFPHEPVVRLRSRRGGEFGLLGRLLAVQSVEGLERVAAGVASVRNEMKSSASQAKPSA